MTASHQGQRVFGKGWPFATTSLAFYTAGFLFDCESQRAVRRGPQSACPIRLKQGLAWSAGKRPFYQGSVVLDQTGQEP